MQNYIQDGTRVMAAATAARASGAAQLISTTMLGVASNDLESAEVGPFMIEGVFELPKLSTDDMDTIGQLVNWNDTNREFQEATSDLDACGVVMETAANGILVVRVKLVNPP